jgi:uncharacterized membrane protein YkvA (DUF1232 family)
MNLSEKRDAKKRFEKSIKNVDTSKIESTSKKGSEKIKKMDDNPPNSLGKYWDDIKLMIGLIGDYYSGKYRDIPWKVLTSIVGAVAYFISPVDAIPDIIPILGYTDDAFILKLALDFAKEDLDKYKSWKKMYN